MSCSCRRRNRETNRQISTVKGTDILLDPHRTSQVGPRPLSSNDEADVVVLLHLPGLTAEVVHEAGLGGDDPLGSRLTEDGDVVFGMLAQRRQPPAQLGGCCEDLLIGEPVVLTQNQLKQRRETSETSC